MPRRTVPLVAEEYYHVYNRGNNRQVIFFRPQNYTFFSRQFRDYVASQCAHVIAYVLMPNHFHFVLQAKTDDLSRAMQRLGISYTKAVNKSLNRVGHVFQGAFQARHIDQEAYLLHLTRYLHLNPVRARLVERPENWEFSSYLEFIGLRAGTLPQPQIIWQEFRAVTDDDVAAQRRYRDFVESYQPADRTRIAHLLMG